MAIIFPISLKAVEKKSNSQIMFLAVSIFIVFSVVIAVHWPALFTQALSFDDVQYLTTNPLVQNPGWSSTRRFLTEILKPSTVGGYYQPLSMISLMIDYAMGGRSYNLLPFHCTSLTLHAVNTGLIVILLYLLFGRIWTAAVVGLLFGLHPMTVEPIPWVGERKTLLATFFALWCVIFYVRYARKGSRKAYISSLLMYILALMSKPTPLMLPFGLLILDWWPLRRFNREALIEKVSFFVVFCLFALVIFLSQSMTAGAHMPVEYGTQRVPLVLCHNIIFYLFKIVWPVKLSSHYAFPQPMALSNGMVLAGVIGTCVFIPLLLISLGRTPAVVGGWLFFFILILPTMQIIGFSNVIASDKFAYLPSVGLLFILAYFLAEFDASRNKLVLKRVLIASVVLVLAIGESVATRRYLVHWRDTTSLFEHMLTITPDAPTVHNHLGTVLDAQGRTEEAMTHYRRAIELKPKYFDPYNNLGIAFQSQGQIDKAVEHYRRALQLKPDFAEAHYNLGNIFILQRKPNEAISSYRRALQIRPAFAEAYTGLGKVFHLAGIHQKAAANYRKALELRPELVEAHYGLANTLRTQGKIDEALSRYRKVLLLKPDHAGAYRNMGITLILKGKFDEAISCYRKVLQLAPDNADAYQNLATVFQYQGKTDEAIEYYHKVLQLDPDFAGAHYNLGVAYQTQGKFTEAATCFQRALEIDPNDSDAKQSLHAVSQFLNKDN